MSIAEIKINHPGDGDWVMGRVQGHFDPMTDQVISLHRDGYVCGGVVYAHYLGSAVGIHMAGNGRHWATPEFLHMVFDYAFNQLGVRKLVGMVNASNKRALKIDYQLGFVYETRLRDMYPDGSDVIFLSMTKELASHWLYEVKPRYFRTNLPPITIPRDPQQLDLAFGLEEL